MNAMKLRLRDDRVYQAIMSGALWIVVIAAFSTTKWPQLSWLTGSITAVLVGIVAAVYWIVVVMDDDDKLDSAARGHPSTQPATREEARGGQNVARQGRSSPVQQREDFAEYREALSKSLEGILRSSYLSSRTYEGLHRRLAQIDKDEAGRIWGSSFDGLVIRSGLVHAPHHGSQRRASTTRNLTIGDEETSEKVVVVVGSVRIEIQEDDPNKTTSVQITSPKTVAVNVTETVDRNQKRPQEYGPPRPPPTIH